MSRLIIKNLPKNFTEEKIRKKFSQKGEITDIQLKFTKDGKFRQFAFVGYKTEEQAQEAIKFFNDSFIQTSKIKVEICAQLGDESKPKAWSKYAPDSSAFKKDHQKNEETEDKSETKEERPQIKKQSKIQELVEKYKDDPMFEEFMQLHGTTDINSLMNKLEENAEKLESSENQNEQTEESDEDSGHESSEESEEKVANKKISDLEYMKLLMNKSVDKKREPRKKMEKQPKKEKILFTVKMRGLAYTCKKKDIKEFFKPNIPYTVRIPPKIKGIAYATFKTEKKMIQALNKDRSFLGGKRIKVCQHSSNKDIVDNEANTNPVKNKWATQEESLKNEENIAESGRIFLRNLSYTTTENDVQELFSKYGPITEINLPIDKYTRQLKGFGIITFLMPEHAVKAYSDLDGSILQGRMLHLLPGKSKDVPEELQNTEGLSYKEKKALKDKATAGSSHNWNSLFMGHNAVADAIADNYGTSKEQVLDGRGPGSAAVRLALGETQLVSQTKEFLEEMGVRLDAFNQPCSLRSKTVILVKNLPAQTQASEIQNIFSPFGILGRVVLPPNGITALVEFLEPSEARKAFTNLAYTKFKTTPLYLEWAPENTFSTAAKINPDKKSKKDKNKHTESKTEIGDNISEETEEIKEEITEENDDNEDEEPEDDTTLFVKNLNFTTTDAILRKHFEPCGKINYVTVAMKKDPQNPGNKLSMGYGFVRFQYQNGANKALKDLQMSTLEGKSLELKRSERTLQNEVKSTRKKSKATKQTGTKILVRNIPFQANWNEINELFKAFGEIKALRLPKKLTSGAERHRGFAFIDYVTKSDAKRAFQALCQSTHLYGRRLVLEWATAEEDVEDIRKRTAKHFHQSEEVKGKKSRIDADTFISN